MPSVGFVLPHWLYWIGLAVFPLIAMFLARHYKPRTDRPYSLVIAYFVWVIGGFLGLHRLYLKNLRGMLFWPLFALVLYGSAAEREVRVVISDARSEIVVVDNAINRSERRIAKSAIVVEETLVKLAEADAADTARTNRLQKKVDKARVRIATDKEKIADINQTIEQLKTNLSTAEESGDFWRTFARYVFYIILLFLAFDLIAIPRLKRRADEHLAAHPMPPVLREDLGNDRQYLTGGITGVFDRISLYAGEFVAFWSVIAVFAYYYEVVVRYVFNSPTNWVHESMFLMFGMQYLIAGSYAMLTETHVRVDIFYARFSRRGKAIVDLFTSVFFFIFAGTLLVTGFTFATDAMQGGDWTKWEVSFTEWAIQYWPVKIAIGLGAVLLILQGISHVLRNLALVFVTPKSKQEST